MFGGVQVYQILIEIIKSKFIAILLGPVGVGIQGLFSSGTMMIQQLTSLGLSQSAVRNVAEANGSANQLEISRTVTALKRLVYLTGSLGMLTVVLFSPLLSFSSFGNYDYTWGFIALAITLLFNQINAGNKVILQGTRNYGFLAKCNIYGVTFGLLVSVPLFYLWGIRAIVPNMILGSITTLMLSFFFSGKLSFQKISQSFKDTFLIGRSMLVMGLTLCLTGFLPYASSYILRSFISRFGGLEMVGLFSAGFILMTQYSGLVFQAMSTDYYPRLAAVNHDNEKCREIMNQQGEIGMLLLGPLMSFCIIFIPIVVRVLYSEDFLAINDYIVWCSLGVIIQMASWTISHIFLAKAESKLFAINEISTCVYGLLLNIVFYYYAELAGLGISFSIKYLIYFIQVYIIARYRYDFSFSSIFVKLFMIQLIIVIISILIVFNLELFYRYLSGAIVVLLSSVFSTYELNKRIGILGYINKLRKKSHE